MQPPSLPLNQNQNLFLTTSSRHHALQTRNPLASHAFIYSVLTTKIYCRPTCPSRLARRANIVFHDSPAQAAADGFRACKRCKPDENLDEDGGLGQQGRVVERVRVLIECEGGRGKKWSVKELANEVGWTESHFCRVFKRVTGFTVGEYRGFVQERKRDVAAGECARELSTPMVVDVDVDVDGQNEDVYEMEPSSGEHTTTWLLNDDVRIVDGVVDLNFSNCALDLHDGSFGIVAEKVPEDCFEFLDFGSPPPLAFDA